MNPSRVGPAINRTLALFKVGLYRTPRRTVVWRNPPSDHKHQRIVPTATYVPWLNDARFLGTYNAIREHTKVDVFRCYELWILAKQAYKVDGDVLEIGVWRGGTGIVLAEAVKDDPRKRIYLADTFSGVVKAGTMDPTYKGGEHSDTSEQWVENLFSSRSMSNYEILVGMFPEDTGDSVRGKLSLVHCDVDVYQSAKDVFNWCLPRFSIGSIIVFDDYGFSGCEGVTTFCEEINSRDDFIFIHNLNGHAIFVKIS